MSDRARGETHRNTETGLEFRDEEGADPCCPKCGGNDLLRFSHVAGREANTPPQPNPSAYATCHRCCLTYLWAPLAEKSAGRQ